MAKMKLSKVQLKAMHAKRTYQARNRDDSQRAQHTYPDTVDTRAAWADNPRRVDIEGLDTPTVRTAHIAPTAPSESIKEWDTHNPNLPKHKQIEHAMIKAREGKKLTKTERVLISEQKIHVESEHTRKESERRRRLGFLSLGEVEDTPSNKLNKTRLDPKIDYLPNENDAQIRHVVNISDRSHASGAAYSDKYIMLAKHSAEKREIEPTSGEGELNKTPVPVKQAHADEHMRTARGVYIDGADCGDLARGAKLQQME